VEIHLAKRFFQVDLLAPLERRSTQFIAFAQEVQIGFLSVIVVVSPGVRGGEPC
jgi:hypothetical protein